jgi:penicillin amidase
MTSILELLEPVLKLYINSVSRIRKPASQAVLFVPGITEKCEVIRDHFGVPHIYAANEHDLFFAQGYVHAQDRFFQMELNRRTANGALSELVGEVALDTDRAVRIFGFNRLWKEDWKNFNPEMRQVIEAYTQGINAWLTDNAGKLPVEFGLLGAKPRPWTIDDSMALSRMLIWEMGHAWYGEIVRAKFVEAVGEEHAADWEIEYPAGNPYTMTEGIEFNEIDKMGKLQGAHGPYLQNGIGSNVFAVAGTRTDTGKPYLCNDMHLILGLPGIWYENHLESSALHVTGVSLPGFPMVLVGHNDRIAWGCTLAYTDCEDLFVEKINPENPKQCEFKGQWEDMQIIPEPIVIKGKKEPYIENVRITRHGPIISEVWGYPQKALSDQSTCLQTSQALEGWLGWNKAANWNDFVNAAKKISAPQLSVGYGDVDGNIGWWATGKVPIRAKGNGLIPAPGWTGEYEWSGEIPFEEAPHVFNPKKGFVVNSNNKIDPEDYPYFLGSIWMNGYRARRITDILQSKEKVGWEDFREIQCDITCLPAKEFVQILAGFPEVDKDVKFALNILREWDFKLTADSVAGTIYEVVRRTLVKNLLEPVLGKQLMQDVTGFSMNTVLVGDNEFYGHDTSALFRILGQPENWWLQQAGGREKLITDSIHESMDWLRKELGSDPAAWQWGKIHRLTLEHALGMQKPLDKIYNRGPYPIGGDTDTVWQAAMMTDKPYDNRLWAPSMRHIIDLSDFSKSRYVLPFGQSENLASEHYSDFTKMWLNKEYTTMLWTRTQVEENAAGKTTLNPAK